jgi:hypothetical protein
MTTPISVENTQKHHQTPLQSNDCCLSESTKKVTDIVLSRWGLVAAAGLATAMAMGSIAAGAIATGVLALTTWYVCPSANAEAKKAIGEFLLISANVLGIFSDPFEFAGNYGDFINSVKAQVEARLIGRAMHPGTAPTEGEIQSQLNYGPTLQELCPVTIKNSLRNLFGERGLDVKNFDATMDFFNKHSHSQLFHFFKNCPSALLSLDLALRQEAKNGQRPFPLPIVNSSITIYGNNSVTHKLNLADVFFTQETKAQAKNIDKKLQEQIDKSAKDFRVGDELVDPKFLKAFATPEGQMLFYYLYQIMNLHLVADIIPQINQAKAEFAENLGDPAKRAEIFAEQCVKAGGDVVFTQECDSYVPAEMEKRGYFSTQFIPGPDGKPMLRSKDGSVIFLKETRFKKNFISEPYLDSDIKHKATIIIAQEIENEIPNVFSSCHGDAKVAKDARDQIERVHGVFQRCKTINPNARMAMGSDTNTNDDSEVSALQQLVNSLKLLMSEVGNTVIKMRKVTVQHEKTNKLDQTPKDRIITSDNLLFIKQTVGGQIPPLDKEIMLPNKDIVSDHGPVAVHVTSAAAAG